MPSRGRWITCGAVAALCLAPAWPAAASDEDWYALVQGGPHSAFAVHFFDEWTGLVATSGENIYRTTDGGRTWTGVHAGGGVSYASMEFPTTLVGYASMLDGGMSKTTDGGLSWTTSVVAGSSIYGVQFPTGTEVGYVAGEGGAIYKTCDGGANWVLQGTGVATRLSGLDFPVDTTTGWSTGAAGKIVKRTGHHMICGTYAGNGVDGRAITGLGFSPAFLMIKAATAEPLVVRSSTMAGDATKALVDAAAPYADRIQSLDADGFTLGTDADVNGNGTTYHYIAFKEVAGEMDVGTYTGTGVDQGITGLGFTPAYVIAWGEGLNRGWQRGSGMSASFRFDAAAGSAITLKSLDADGFTVGTSAAVNANGTTFHYVAWKAVAGKVVAGSGAGDGTDDRVISSMGLRPDALMVCAASTATMFRPESITGADGYSCYASATANAQNMLQELQDDGYELGTGANASGTTYYFIAWGGKWNLQTTPNGTALWGIDMLDESTGYVAGNAGRVWKTTDGGTNWAQTTIAGASNLTFLDFPLDATTGWVCGYSGKIYKTTDSGGAWTQQSTTLTTEHVWKIQMLDEVTGFAVGDLGATLRSRLPRMIGGRYTGDGNDARAITGLGFQPDAVIIQGYGEDAVIRTSTMAGDQSRPIDGSASMAITTNIIESLDADGFTVGTDARVNAAGTRYFWTAMRADAEIAVGSYAGNGVDHSITGLGFEPGFLMVVGSGDAEAAVRFGDMTGDATFQMSNGAAVTNRIQAFESDGFEVGSSNRVNSAGWTYHYVAIKPLAGQIRMGSYTGDGNDNRAITGLGFRPEWVVVKGDTNQYAHHKMNAFGGREASFQFNEGTYGNCIQSLDSDGFTLGYADAVNDSGVTYYWMAMNRNTLEQAERKPTVLSSVEKQPH